MSPLEKVLTTIKKLSTTLKNSETPPPPNKKFFNISKKKSLTSSEKFEILFKKPQASFHEINSIQEKFQPLLENLKFSHIPEEF